MDSLTLRVSKVLPIGEWKLVCVQLAPARIKPVIHTNGAKPDSIKVRHFFELLTSDGVPVMAIEIFVYLQIYPNHFDQYLFVPKCDTVGLVPVNVGQVIRELLQWVMEYLPANYIITSAKPKKVAGPTKSTAPENVYRIGKLKEKLRRDPKVVEKWYHSPRQPSTSNANAANRMTLPPIRELRIALFTKSAPLYIFPQLQKNRHKRVATGANLLRWWLRVLDQLTSEQWTRKVDIPGAEAAEISKYLKQGWTQGHIFGGDELPAVSTVPLFPDDPKGRFLEHLIVEGRHPTTAKFYYELGYRQEFRLGDVVGLVGCTCSVPTLRLNGDKLCRIVSVSGYKRFICQLKSIDYSHRSQAIADTAALVKNEVVLPLHGTATATPRASDTAVAPVNDLSGLIRKRRKQKPQQSPS